jgi:hypothetical protein
MQETQECQKEISKVREYVVFDTIINCSKINELNKQLEYKYEEINKII